MIDLPKFKACRGHKVLAELHLHRRPRGQNPATGKALEVSRDSVASERNDLPQQLTPNSTSTPCWRPLAAYSPGYAPPAIILFTPVCPGITKLSSPWLSVFP
jgi:hypothetical protein